VAAACAAAVRTGRAPDASNEAAPSVRRQAHRARHTAREQCWWHEQPVVAPGVGPAFTPPFTPPFTPGVGPASAGRRRSEQRWRCACGAPSERRDCADHHGGVGHAAREHPCCPRGRPQPCARDGADDACTPRRLGGPDAIPGAAPPPPPSAWHVTGFGTGFGTALEPSITGFGTALFPHAHNGARADRPWRRRRFVNCVRPALTVPIWPPSHLPSHLCTTGRPTRRAVRLPSRLARSVVLDDQAPS